MTPRPAAAKTGAVSFDAQPVESRCAGAQLSDRRRKARGRRGRGPGQADPHAPRNHRQADRTVRLSVFRFSLSGRPAARFLFL